jgi:hypothetical protein
MLCLGTKLRPWMAHCLQVGKHCKRIISCSLACVSAVSCFTNFTYCIQMHALWKWKHLKLSVSETGSDVSIQFTSRFQSTIPYICLCVAVLRFQLITVFRAGFIFGKDSNISYLKVSKKFLKTFPRYLARFNCTFKVQTKLHSNVHIRW